MSFVDTKPSVHRIVMEASSKDEKKYATKLSKSEVHQVNGTLIQNLYKSVMDRKEIDFGDIPDSKGDIEACKYYKSTVESLDTLAELYMKNHIDEPSVGEVKLAIANVKRFKKQFMEAFRLKHDMAMMTYNATVMSIIDATSLLIASYVNYVVGADEQYFVNHQQDKFRGYVSLDNLRSFNAVAENGNLAQALQFMNEESRKNFMGEELIIPAVVIACLLSIVPIIREMIYHYYVSRVKIADYLNMQADFLEMNKLAVESSGKSPAQKKAIVKKQSDLIKKMRTSADKLTINNVDTNDVAKKEIKSDNSLWSLGNIEKQLSNKKLTGVALNII